MNTRAAHEREMRELDARIAEYRQALANAAGATGRIDGRSNRWPDSRLTGVNGYMAGWRAGQREYLRGSK